MNTWKITFKDGVAKIMDNWGGLGLAVEHQFGGPDSEEKHEWLKEVTADFMLDNGILSLMSSYNMNGDIVIDDVDKEELEEYISVLMDQEFNTILEDGSTVKVFNSICYQRR